MALRPINSEGGYSIGANATVVIDENANVIANALTVAGTSNLGDLSNVTIEGGNNGYYLQTDGSGVLAWVAGGGSGNGETGGSNTQVQFNDGGLFGGSTRFTWNKASNTLSVSGNLTVSNGVANLGTVGNLRITGGNNGQFLRSSGNGVVSFANIVAFDQPSILFTNASNGNNKTFTNANIASFSSNTQMSVYYNGVLMNTAEYTVSGNTLTVNRYLYTDDQITVGAVVRSIPTPGSNTQLFFNTDGEFDASANLTWDASSDTLTVVGNISTTAANITGNLTAQNANITGNLVVNTQTWSGAWSTYTPSWTASSVNPAIGNGTISGRWKQTGSTVSFVAKIVMGNTTTFGTGDWRITLPVTAYNADSVLINAICLDDGTRWHPATAFTTYDGNTTYVTVMTPDGNVVTSTTPFTWANGDTLTIAGTYEAL